MSGRSLHNKLKPVVLGMMASGFDPEATADMILNFILGVMNGTASITTSTTAVVPVAAKAKTKSGRPDGRRRPRIHVPPLKKQIDDDREYTVKEAAELMGIEEGYFRAWYPKRGKIEVVRKESASGMPRIFFTGAAIKAAHAARLAATEA